MPRRTEWIQHIPTALAELRALPSPTIDRRTLESLFHVSPRQALRILSSLGSYPAGKSLLIERHDLIGKLESLSLSEPVRFEQTRHLRVSQHLERYRKDQKARRTQIPVPREAVSAHIASLPQGVSLYPGMLQIAFHSPEDLLGKLYVLAQAISNDYAAFEESIG